MCEKKGQRRPFNNQVCDRCSLTNNDSFKEQLNKYCQGGEGCMLGREETTIKNDVVRHAPEGGFIVGGSSS